jgi:hypothetical protein
MRSNLKKTAKQSSALLPGYGLIQAQVSELPDNGMQRTALRAAADAERR